MNARISPRHLVWQRGKVFDLIQGAGEKKGGGYHDFGGIIN
jgi:hypothetical protein